MKISTSEIVFLAAIGLIAQNLIVAGNVDINSFYNRYLGFSLLFPLYAIFMTYIVSQFSLTRKIIILPLSMFLLSVTGFINFSLYPIMGGSTGQMYSLLFLFGILPGTLITGAIYGLYITYKIKNKIKNNTMETQDQDEETLNTISTTRQSKHFKKQLITIWLIGFSIIALSFLTYLHYNKLLISVAGLITGIGVIMRIKWMRWVLLIVLYTLLLSAFYSIFSDFKSFYHLDNYPFFGFITLQFLYFMPVLLLSNKESFKQFGLDYSTRKTELITLAIIATLIIIFFNLLGIALPTGYP